jgi:hypothetical protein
MKTGLSLAATPVADREEPHAVLRLTQRILLFSRELYRVPSCYRRLLARQGIAHISHGGRDLILMPGESVTLAQIPDVALVSPLRGEALVLELFA